MAVVCPVGAQWIAWNTWARSTEVAEKVQWELRFQGKKPWSEREREKELERDDCPANRGAEESGATSCSRLLPRPASFAAFYGLNIHSQ